MAVPRTGVVSWNQAANREMTRVGTPQSHELLGTGMGNVGAMTSRKVGVQKTGRQRGCWGQLGKEKGLGPQSGGVGWGGPDERQHPPVAGGASPRKRAGDRACDKELNQQWARRGLAGSQAAGWPWGLGNWVTVQ